MHTLSATGAIGDAVPGQNEFRAGGRQAVAQYFQGRIDEVRVYRSALAAGEVAGLAGATAASTTANIQWLVTDHLGTPRMVVDETGNLAGIRRHDYLPFGEEVGAGAGGRTTNQGYSGADGVRQGFTGYEKDGETGLNFAQARYHSPMQGRFTSVDPLMESGEPLQPQSWNRYSYVLNNPLAYVDPTGLIWGRVGDGDVTWYKDKAAMDEAGATEWTELVYGIGNDQYVRLSSTGPNANGSSQEARQGWSIFTQPSMQGQPDNAGVAQLFAEFLFGVGPTHRTFGPDSYMTHGMMTSPDVAAHRQAYCEGACTGELRYGPEVIGQFGFGAEDGPVEATFDMSRPRHFVGSFSMTITQQSPDGNTLFQMDNITSRVSGGYHLPFLVNSERAGVRSVNNLNIGANTRQTYWWTEKNPCGCK